MTKIHWRKIEFTPRNRTWAWLEYSPLAEERFMFGELLEALSRGELDTERYIVTVERNPIDVSNIDWSSYDDQKEVDEELEGYLKHWIEVTFPDDAPVDVSVKLNSARITDEYQESFINFYSVNALSRIWVDDTDSVWSVLWRVR